MNSPHLARACAALAVAALVGLSAAPAQAALARPDSLTGLTIWLRGDDLTAGHADNDPVSTWVDASGNGNNLAALASVGGDPLVNPLFNVTQVPTLLIQANTDQLMKASNVNGNSGLSDVTVIAVYKTAATDSNNRPYGFGSAREGSGANNLNLAVDGSIRKDNGFIAGAAQPSDTFFIRSNVMTAASGGSVEQYYNGVQNINSTADYTVANDEFYVGNVRIDGAGFGSGTDIAEVIVFDRALSTAERQSVEGYLQAKYFSNAYYRFEEGTAGSPAPVVDGVVMDHTVNTNDATAVGVSSNPTYVANTPNSVVPLTGSANNLAMDFERSAGQYLSVPDHASLDFGDSSFTVEAYVNFETAPGAGSGTRQYLVLKKGTNNLADSQADYGVVFSEAGAFGGAAAGELVFQQGDGSTANFIRSGLILTDTTDWHYVSVAFDAENDLVRFILDDQIVEVVNTFAAVANNSPLLIGAHFSGTGTRTSFDGMIDELRITGGFLQRSQLLTGIPTPAALPAGLTLLAVGATRRRVNRCR